jgi:conjugal transfer/entry exclusion protein
VKLLTIVSNVKQTLSTIKNIEAQLSSFAINSLDENAKKVFHETMLTICDVKDDLQNRVYELERAEPQYKG